MVNRVVLVAVLALSSLAHADSPKLAQARAAIDEVKLDDAQRLLVGALQDGRNSPAAVREIYRLAGDTSVALGQRDVGEQYYRRWLALEPAATMSSDVSPKLREPFDAARAYIAAHGSLVVRAARGSDTEVVLEVSSDPLAMVRSAQLVGQGAVPLSGGSIKLAATAAAAHAEVLDEYGNILVEVDIAPTAAIVTAPVNTDVPRVEPRSSHAWIGFAVPSVVCLGVALGFGTSAVSMQSYIDADLDDHGKFYFSDIDDRVQRMQRFAWISAGSAALGVVLAIPAVVLFTRRSPAREVVPFVSDDGAGVSVLGRF